MIRLQQEKLQIDILCHNTQIYSAVRSISLTEWKEKYPKTALYFVPTLMADRSKFNLQSVTKFLSTIWQMLQKLIDIETDFGKVNTFGQ